MESPAIPTLRTVTVGPNGTDGGYDYASLAAALAGEVADLVTLNQELDVACHAMTDTSPVTVFGWTLDEAHRLRIYAPAGERHAGVFNPAKYNLTVSGYWNYALRILNDHVIIEGLQVSNSVSGQDVIPALIYLNVGGSGCLVDSCLLSGGPNPGSGYGLQVVSGGGTIRNTIISGCPDDAVYSQNLSVPPTVRLDNCTLIGGAGYAVRQADSTLTLRNVYAHGGTDAYSGSMTWTTCAHSSATGFSGSTANVPRSTATFTNVTPSSEDYHLAAGSALIGAGTDLSPDFTTDIDGAIRSAPWDIGADQHAGGLPLAAGTAALVSSGPGGIAVSAAPATGGTAPYTYRWQRRTSGGGSYADLANGGGVSGATTLALTDGSAVAGTLYDYRLVATDSGATPATATSNSVPAQVYTGGAIGPVGVLFIGVGG